jgi:RHS repeat-associated protein
VYGASYDAWGNQTGRTYTSTTATLSYDLLDHLVEWNAGSSSQEWTIYDAAGQRVLTRTTSSSGTTMTTYPFGTEEHQYDSSGNPIGTGTYYYTFAGKLIGVLLGTSMEFVLTDDLGSVRTAITTQAGAATVVGYMGYGPFGFLQYHAGQTGTNKGYTGQDTDPLSGLDYYVARYYDPVVGLFLSVDTVQSNLKGFDPYAYVGNNPETLTDPTGHSGWSTAYALTMFAGIALFGLGLLAASTGIGIAASPFLIGAGVGILAGQIGTGAAYAASHNGQWQPSEPKQLDNYYAQATINGWVGGVVGVGLVGAGVLGGAVVLTGMTIEQGLISAGLGFLGGAGTVIESAVAGWASKQYPMNFTSSTHQQASGTAHPASTQSYSYGYSPRPKPPVKSSDPIPPVSSYSAPHPGLPVARSGSPAPVSQASATYYTVTSGDTLWGIAAMFYGSGVQWQRIYQANVGVIGANPNLIFPGERLKILR